MVRRSEFSSVSDHTSPSSSSVEPIDMTASRSSFLEFIGLRRKKDNDSVTMRSDSPGDCFFPRVVLKKRKRKISESDSIASGGEKVVLKEDRRKSASLTVSARGTYSIESCLNVDDDKKGKNYSFLRNRGSTDKKQHRLSHYFPSDKDDDRTKKKTRPKSAVYLDPDQLSHLNKPLSSKKNRVGFSSRDTSEDSYAFGREEHLSNENAELKEELAMLRNRNSRLISQLKEKSAQQSHTHTQMTKLQLQMEAMRKRCELNESLDRLSLNNRLIIGPESVIDKVEDRLRHLETDVQNAKAEATKNHHVTINACVKDQNSYQSCLEQVERLQRENFSLLQMHAAEMATHDKAIRQKLDLMPSYDALYSFTMGMVRKLGQLRNSLIDKSNQICRSDLELMNTQSSLLITHAQVERLRLQLHMLHNKSRKRPASYHGEDLLERLTKPELNFLLPFKLHASRLEQQHKCASFNMDSLVENNEQSIETEFLRLFDYARCVSKICDETPAHREKPLSRLESVIVYRNGKKATISPSNSPLLSERRRLPQNQPVGHNMRAPGRYPLLRRENSKESPVSKRPTSLVDPSFDKKTSGSIRKFAEDMKRSQQDTERIPSPNLNLHKLGQLGRSGHVQAVVSSLQDVSNSAIRSPTTTPILTRRINNPDIKYSPQPSALKATVLQHYGLSETRHYDLPPNTVSESSDYGTVNPKRTLASGGLPSTGLQNKLPPQKPGTPNRVLPPTSGAIRPKQPGNPAINLKRNPPVSPRRAYTFRNSVTNRSTESPKRVTSAALEAAHEGTPPSSAPFAQDHSNDVLSVSETSSSAAEKLSRLPRLTAPLTEKAVKKATASWLSRLRPSSRK
uniref:t-SNARE coiled-coil homology domain-containing protein n=1 Tax=Steinernema glaseri TaxID=37863 RepID=A0A1I8ADK8_9BILA